MKKKFKVGEIVQWDERHPLANIGRVIDTWISSSGIEMIQVMWLSFHADGTMFDVEKSGSLIAAEFSLRK